MNIRIRKYLLFTIILCSIYVLGSRKNTHVPLLQNQNTSIIQDSLILTEDGPYIFHTENGLDILEISEGNYTKKSFSRDSSFMVQSENGKHQFKVKLHPIKRPDWQYEQPEKMVIISDPHGNMDAFVSILKSAGIIDNKYNWIYGNGHLVVNGDVFDRGIDVLPIFWLIYKLEDEASNAGGAVHFLYGNHEDIVLQNDNRYLEEKYNHLAGKLNMEHCKLWGTDTELGYWLSTRNTIELIDSNMIVHAGISKEFLDKNYSIPFVNKTVSKYIFQSWSEREKNSDAEFLLFMEGPMWYRNMVDNDEDYSPIDESIVDKILEHYNINRIFVGHTVLDEVTSFFHGKVIGINVDNEENMKNNRSRGILIEDGIYLIYDNPENNKKWIP